MEEQKLPITGEEEVSLADRVKMLTPTQLVFKRFFRSKLSIIGLCMLLFLFVFAFLGPLFRFIPGMPVYGELDVFQSDRTTVIAERIPFACRCTPATPAECVCDEGYFYYITYTRQHLATLHQPTWRNILGTDEQSRDIFSRLMYGGRISLMIAFSVVIIATLIGVILGSIAGYFGKWVDQAVMRLVDLFTCIPTLPLLLIVAATMDMWEIDSTMRIVALAILLAITGWAGTTRLVRGQILMLREQDYMLAAEAMGLSVPRRIIKHLIPNVMPQLIVTMTMSLGGIILTEATLSFLGLGVQMPLAAWGTMISRLENSTILTDHFHLWGPPGFLIMVAVLGFNFMGDGLRDALDPKMKR